MAKRRARKKTSPREAKKKKIEGGAFRRLTNTERDALLKNGCTSENWDRVLVAEGFDPERVRAVVFQGAVKIGRLSGTLSYHDSVPRTAGLYRAKLNNVVIGNGCYISDVRGWLSNLVIGDDVLIENAGTIECRGKTAFGNAARVPVLNEGGGRELPITARTSAQIAYLAVFYRGRKRLIERINAMADSYAKSVQADRAPIGSGSRIINVNKVVNVAIGECAEVNGIQSIKEGTVDSSREAKTVVGNGVIAENFIFQKGASIKDGAVIAGTIAGEGCRIGRQFSSENSVFFANAEAFHSEACSVFGGPYTVTHHRPTLLIAAAYSFFNAGSGTNQSNHKYRLGPLHQGVLERGCKTGSFCYLLWPCRIGAFSTVIGRHYSNFDTSELPFSSITEERGVSMILPGKNFFSAGIRRDGRKWPARDRRTVSTPLDLITFDVLSPYTMQKVLRALAILGGHETNDASGKAAASAEFITVGGILMKRSLIGIALDHYRTILDKYFGDRIVTRLAGQRTPRGIRKALEPMRTPNGGAWIDAAGLIAPQAKIETLIRDVEKGTIGCYDAMLVRFRAIHDSYRNDEWDWLCAAFASRYGKAPSEMPLPELAERLAAWKDASLRILTTVERDAAKEFGAYSAIGYGIDGDGENDFAAVRSTFDNHAFIKELRAEQKTITTSYEALKRVIG
ncbi:MAG: DUF4954 family protein [Spirochaetota bacterium]